ncbi:acyltransferase family protein [Muricoccus nepalensis]|nr:acyltransferase [Roseomonas nepalensis]
MQERRVANNFDLIRLAAALGVLFSHAFQLSEGNYRSEPVWQIGAHQTTIGRLAVIVFFIVSGYLITASFQRRPDAARFCLARALRLLPGLAAMLLLVALLAGPALSTVGLRDYLADPQTHRFVVGNLLVFGYQEWLPGLFAANPLPRVVAGSLWTLAYEAGCYGAVLALGLAGLLRRGPVLALYLGLLVANKLWLGGEWVQLGSFFAGGAVMQLWAVPLRAGVAWGCAALLAASVAITGFPVAAATAGVYLVIYLALATRPVALRFGDLSYGTYIYGFPVQQAATMLLGAAASWWSNFLVSLPVVLALAWMSWHWVEAPALALRPWLERRLPPAPGRVALGKPPAA